MKLYKVIHFSKQKTVIPQYARGIFESPWVPKTADLRVPYKKQCSTRTEPCSNTAGPPNLQIRNQQIPRADSTFYQQSQDEDFSHKSNITVLLTEMDLK